MVLVANAVDPSSDKHCEVVYIVYNSEQDEGLPASMKCLGCPRGGASMLVGVRQPSNVRISLLFCPLLCPTIPAAQMSQCVESSIRVRQALAAPPDFHRHSALKSQ